MNFTTSKTKKNIKKFVNHHYIENGFLVDHYYYYNQNIENGFLVDHYIKNHCLFSSSLLQKSERRKECEKNIESLSFVWFSHFDYLSKYLWRFGKNFF
jgi:hypothetical protein